MIIGSKNKGDWSEFYILLNLIGSGCLYAGDEELNRLERYRFPIKKIMRKESSDEDVMFELHPETEKVDIYYNKQHKRTLTLSRFKNWAQEYLPLIKAGSGSFDIPDAEKTLNYIYCKRLAAASSDITDIKVQLHDPITGLDQEMGFSIKSYLGGAPTLLNASGATNFMYEIEGLSDRDMDEINSIETRTKIADRIHAITEKGGTIAFGKPVNETFFGNLVMIDSLMENILAELILYSYQTGIVDCKTLIGHLEETNPIGYPRKGCYEYKFKKFLCAKALGMDPSREWDGIDDANGGYIVVKPDGEVLTYHLYNRDSFEQYLLDNTKLERASTGRHGYAYLYKEQEKMYIKLNLQIRFKDR